MTGSGVEIGLNVLNKRSGPAIRSIISNYPQKPNITFSIVGTGFPNGFL